MIYKTWGNFQYAKIREKTTGDQMLDYHLWLNEQACKQLGHNSIRHGRRIDKFTCVFDSVGLHYGIMRNGSFGFLRDIAIVDQAHYPERLSTIIVINAPRLVSIVWSFISRFLDQRTREKIHIHSSEADWRPVIDRLIARDQLPDTYGGSSPFSFPTGQPLPVQDSVASFDGGSPDNLPECPEPPVSVLPALRGDQSGGGGGSTVAKNVRHRPKMAAAARRLSAVFGMVRKK